MSYRQLLELQARISAAFADRRQAEKAELAQKIEQIAASSGFSLPELLGKPRGRPKSSAGVRYRHPSDPSLTWSGRGRRPKWLASAGRNIERYRVA
jgi:DNA-binding protein H-NS